MHLFRLRSRISEKVVLDGVHRQVPVSVLMQAETMKPARTGLREQSGSQSQGRSSCFPCAGAKDIGERLKGIMASSYELEPILDRNGSAPFRAPVLPERPSGRATKSLTSKEPSRKPTRRGLSGRSWRGLP